MNISDITELFGMNPEIAKAIWNAETDPTVANIKKVVSEYAAIGAVPPGKLMAHLYERNKEVYPEETIAKSVSPWVIGAGVIFGLWILRKL